MPLPTSPETLAPATPPSPEEVWVDVFRAGDYGSKGRYSETDLDALVAGYRPEILAAPVTIDHEQTGPALGWVAGLRRMGDVLQARLTSLAAPFVEAVRARRYRHPSIELYRAGADISGTPEPITGPYLKAVTFLGAATPHVKGLKPPQFSAAPAALEAPFVSIQFDEAALSTDTQAAPPVSTPSPGLGTPTTSGEGIVPPTPSDKADGPRAKDGEPDPETPTLQLQPDQQKRALGAGDLNTMPAPNTTVAASSNPTPVAPPNPAPVVPPAGPSPDAARAAEAESRAAAFAEQNAALARRVEELERVNAETRFTQLFNELAREGRVTKAEQAHLHAQFMDAVTLDRQSGATVAFAENGTTVQLTREELFRRGLKARAVVVEFRELASAEGPEREPATAPTSRDERIMQAVQKYQAEEAKAGRIKTFAEADAALRATSPDIYRFDD